MEVKVLTILDYELTIAHHHLIPAMLPDISWSRINNRKLCPIHSRADIARLQLPQVLPSSVIAASAVLFATLTLHGKQWSTTMGNVTTYTAADLWPCMKELHDIYMYMYVRAPWLVKQASRSKYMSPKYNGVARITSPAAVLHSRRPLALHEGTT